jgi:hypothetical protein
MRGLLIQIITRAVRDNTQAFSQKTNSWQVISEITQSSIVPYRVTDKYVFRTHASKCLVYKMPQNVWFTKWLASRSI